MERYRTCNLGQARFGKIRLGTENRLIGFCDGDSIFVGLEKAKACPTRQCSAEVCCIERVDSATARDQQLRGIARGEANRSTNQYN